MPVILYDYLIIHNLPSGFISDDFGWFIQLSGGTMIGLDERDYRNGIRSLAFLVRRSAESKGEEPSPDGLIRRNACIKCGYEWSVRDGTPFPKRCPSCESTLWNEKGLKRHSCMCCGHAWMSRQDDPLRCPSCRSRQWAEGPRRYVCTACGLEQPDRPMPAAACEGCGSIVRAAPRGVRRATELIPQMGEHILGTAGMTVQEAVLHLRDLGLDLEDAEIVVRITRGEQVIWIASDMDVPAGRVLAIGACLRRTIGGGEVGLHEDM